jgi:hypothetical protein
MSSNLSINNQFHHLLKFENKIYTEYFHIMRSIPPWVNILALPYKGWIANLFIGITIGGRGTNTSTI